jgi:hypothetical protein
MGRSKLNPALQSGTAIPFPHDGPIFHCDEEDILHASGSLQAAKRILKQTSAPTLPSKLCRTLQNASNGKEQFHALHSYRSTILNLRSKKDLDSVPDQQMNNGLYRLLLEWSLSCQSPVPLQRSLQSVLSCVKTADEREISIEVLRSFLKKHQKDWRNPLFSLDVAAHDTKLAKILKTLLFSDCLSFLFQNFVSTYILENDSDQQPPHQQSSPSLFVKESIVVSKILKILLHNLSPEQEVPYFDDFQSYVLMLFGSSRIPTDSYNTLGIIYGNLLLAKNPKVEDIIITVESLDSDHASLSSLARLSMLQGIAATLDLQTLLATCNGTSPLESCWKYSLRISQIATDPMVRWGALKGLSTLAVRWSQADASSSTTNNNNNNSTTTIDSLIQETLQVVLQAWENPPLRKLAKAIPGLFQTLVQLLNEEQTQRLCQNVLEQPANRKGKYLALDILLAHVPPEMAIRADSLLEGIGDRGANTSPIADLWTKILEHLWTNSIENNTTSVDKQFEEWTAQWVPSIALALVSRDLARRKQVAMFCLPRIVDLMKRLKTLQTHISKSFVALFDEIKQIQEGANDSKKLLETGESLSDRALWAHLEVRRSAPLVRCPV